MDNAIILQQFDEIEKKAERLLMAFHALEAEKGRLQNRIDSLTAELQEKTEAEKKYEEERDLIRSKIDGLLVKLEDVAAEEN